MSGIGLRRSFRWARGLVSMCVSSNGALFRDPAPSNPNPIHRLSSPAHSCALLRTHWLLFLGLANNARPPSTTIEITCFSVASY